MDKHQNCAVLLVIAVLMQYCCIAQTKFAVDASVKLEYEKALKHMPIKFAPILDQKNEQGQTVEMLKKMGISFFTVYRVDTLNIESLIYPRSHSYIKVTDAHPSTEKEKDYSDGDNTYIPVLTPGRLSNDTLFARLPWVFEPAIELSITRGSVQAIYKDYMKNESIFRTSLTDVRKEMISLAMHISRFTVSNAVFKEGSTIYGKADMQTPVFYVDDANFKTGYRIERVFFKYVFKLIINSNPL